MMDIREFHGHVYFDEATVQQAVDLCKKADDLFDIKMGRVHKKLIRSSSDVELSVGVFRRSIWSDHAMAGRQSNWSDHLHAPGNG